MISKEKISEILQSLWKKYDGTLNESRIVYNRILLDVQTAIDNLSQEECQPKQEWSEEDERLYRELHNLIYSTPYCDSRKELSDWLESLKTKLKL